MSNVIQHTSRGKHVTVRLKGGTSYNNVVICPDPLDPYSRKHIIEKSNGDTNYIRTIEIEGVYKRK